MKVRFPPSQQIGVPLFVKRCAALRVNGEWVLVYNPTIGHLTKLRRQGPVVVLHQIVRKNGHIVYTDWVTETGVPVVCQIDYE